MYTTPMKQDLPPESQRLVELMQRINFGRIFDLPVHNSQPVMDPPPRVVREIKFGGDNGPRLESAKPDFAIKVQIRELFSQLQALEDGVIPCIEIQHGLPFRMTIEETPA